jgi:esterase/lipase
MRKAKKARENGDIPENGTKFAGKVKNDSKEKKVIKALNEALKQENEEAITELAEKYPEEVKEILKQKIDSINKSQELGKKISNKRQEDVLKISSAMKTAKEQVKEIEQVEYKDAR